MGEELQSFKSSGNHLVGRLNMLKRGAYLTTTIGKAPLASLYFCDQKQQSENRSLIFEGQGSFLPTLAPACSMQAAAPAAHQGGGGGGWVANTVLRAETG